MALAIALIVGLAALGMHLYQQAGSKTPVLVVAWEVPAGHVVARADLSTVSVAGPVTAVAAGHIDSGGPDGGGGSAAEHVGAAVDADRGSPIGAGQVKVGVAASRGSRRRMGRRRGPG